MPAGMKGLFIMPDTPRLEASRTNWAMLRSRSDQDIERLAAEDADNPATTEEDWADGFGRCELEEFYYREILKPSDYNSIGGASRRASSNLDWPRRASTVTVA